MPARCDDVAEALPAILDGHSRADAAPALVDHVESCLRCQAELARYRRLLRMLAQLRAERPELPPGFVSGVLDALGEAAERRAIRSALSGRRVAYAAGLVAAALAAAGLVLAGRARPGRAARAGSAQAAEG